MSLLSYSELVSDIVEKNVLAFVDENGVRSRIDEDQVNSSSIDITLGRSIFVERQVESDVVYRNRTPLPMAKIYIDSGYCLRPGEFILAQSAEQFFLPADISAEYKLKSSMARIGLEHLNAGWCDAGWNGSVLTLEIKNMTRYSSIFLFSGDSIGQMVFFRHTPVPHDRSYAARGRYNQDTSVSGIKK